jgi:hypothetical protein
LNCASDSIANVKANHSAMLSMAVSGAAMPENVVLIVTAANVRA